jgi:probable phosphoglycerate mutase
LFYREANGEEMKTTRYTEFLVMRHGQSVADVAKPKVFEGRMDSPLTEAGLDQARLAAKWIAAKYPPQRIISSPLIRAMRTAEEVALRVRVDVECDPGLLERNNGALAGLTEREAKAQGFLPPGG